MYFYEVWIVVLYLLENTHMDSPQEPKYYSDSEEHNWYIHQLVWTSFAHDIYPSHRSHHKHLKRNSKARMATTEYQKW